MKEKTLEMKKIVELIKQSTHEKKDKKNTWRYCSTPNWTPLHKCPATEVNCNKCGKKGHYAKAWRQKFNNNRTVKRLTEEERSEPNDSSCESDKDIQHIKEF